MPDVAGVAFSGRDLFEAASLSLLLLAGIVALMVAREGWPAVRQHPQRIGRVAALVVAAVALGFILKETLGSTQYGSAIATGAFVLAFASYLFLRQWTGKGDEGPDAKRQLRRALAQPISWPLVGGLVIALVALALIETVLFQR
jgi:hypothetical protein